MKSKEKRIQKGINLIPDFMLKERHSAKRLFIVGLLTVVITLASYAVYIIPEMKIFTLGIQIENVNNELKAFKDLQVLDDKFKETKNKLDQKKEILKSITENEIDIMPLINKVLSAAPQNVFLSYLNVGENKEISVSYIINNPVEANLLANNLRKLNMFEKVDMPSIPIVDRKMDISFKLKLKDEQKE